MKYVTKKVRASYVNLAEPNQLSGKYQLDLLIPKGSEEAKRLEKAIEDATQEAVRTYKKWNGKPPVKSKTHPVLKDGDEKIESAEKPENYEAYEGMWYITPKAEKAKDFYVFDRDRTLIDVDEIYSGCYVRASIELYPYAHELGGKGISASLLGVQLVADGESLGGAHRSEDSVSADFNDDEDFDDLD